VDILVADVGSLMADACLLPAMSLSTYFFADVYHLQSDVYPIDEDLPYVTESLSSGKVLVP